MGAERDTIDLARLWAEVMLPFGFLRFGRMPSDFGMGVFSNSGLPKKTAFGWEGLDKNYGDTYDRLLFGTKIGPYIPVLVYDRVVEADFKTGDRDVHQYVLVQYLRDIKLGQNSDFNGGLYLMHRRQKSTNARLFAYNLWLRFKFGGFVIENEGVALQGSLTQIPEGTIDDLEEAGLPTGEGAGKIEVNAFVDAFRMSTKRARGAWAASSVSRAPRIRTRTTSSTRPRRRKWRWPRRGTTRTRTRARTASTSSTRWWKIRPRSASACSRSPSTRTTTSTSSSGKS
ncbi:MAG: hypothetical protein M5R36_18840 [Deltaproteobacteria bacterium]|nr:hypothetical protein [Deltaproteobacteria bacterium]